MKSLMLMTTLGLIGSVFSEAAEQTEGAASAPAKKKTEVEKVTMSDGREVEFAGKRKLNKDYVLNEDGTLKNITLDFRNGITRTIVIPDSLVGQFAGHGALQKYGDELAGLKGADGGEADIDDMILTIDQLDENIQAGKWSTRVPGDGMGGTSVLIQALVEYSGKTIDKIKAFLKDKDPKFKMAMRLNDQRPNTQGETVASIVKKLEAAKAAKGTKVDTNAALGDLDAMEG
jgi:hypothetical protein